MTDKSKVWIQCLLLWGTFFPILMFCIGHWKGYNSGQKETTIAMAHFLSPKKYQDSPYKWQGWYFEKMLCEKNGIDYEGEWIISCPKCVGGAKIQRTQTGMIYYGFHTNYAEMDKLKPSETFTEKDTLGQTYCKNCYYPQGTDWLIKEIE